MTVDANIKKANVALAKAALRYAEKHDKALVDTAQLLVDNHYCDTVEHAMEVLREKYR